MLGKIRIITRSEWQCEQLQAASVRIAVENANVITKRARRIVAIANKNIATAQAATIQSMKVQEEAEQQIERAIKEQQIAAKQRQLASNVIDQANHAALASKRFVGLGGALRAFWDGMMRSTLVERIKCELSPQIEAWRTVAIAAEARAAAAEIQARRFQDQIGILRSAVAELGSQRDALRLRLHVLKAHEEMSIKITLHSTMRLRRRLSKIRLGWRWEDAMAQKKNKIRNCGDRRRTYLMLRTFSKNPARNKKNWCATKLAALLSLAIQLLSDKAAEASEDTGIPAYPILFRPVHHQTPYSKRYKSSPSWVRLMTDIARPVARSAALEEIRSRLPISTKLWLDDVVRREDWAALRICAFPKRTDEAVINAIIMSAKAWQDEFDSSLGLRKCTCNDTEEAATRFSSRDNAAGEYTNPFSR